jgi:hypothetical protein
MKIEKPNDIKIHFIIGSGRSGTTLLFHILNNHKNCVSSPEFKHLLFFYKKYHNMKEVTPELLKDVEYFGRIMKEADDMSDYYDYSNSKFNLTLNEKINYFEFCKRVYFIFANHKNDTNQITTIIDKNPNYTLHVDELTNILPDAKFLCAIRDYRSYVLSNIQSKGYNAKHLPIQYHALVWMFYNRLVLKIKNKYFDKVKVIKYETLVSEKEVSLKEICDFFNIEYDLTSLNFQNIIKPQNDDKQRHERIANKMNALSKPINTERLEAWKSIFTDFQLKVIEFWCGKLGENFGYKTTKKSNLFQSITILFISFPYYIRVWAYFKLKSVRLDFYLNEGRRAKYFNSLKK